MTYNNNNKDIIHVFNLAEWRGKDKASAVFLWGYELKRL